MTNACLLYGKNKQHALGLELMQENPKGHSPLAPIALVIITVFYLRMRLISIRGLIE